MVGITEAESDAEAYYSGDLLGVALRTTGSSEERL